VPISGKALALAVWLIGGLLAAGGASVLAAVAAAGLALLGLPPRVSIGGPVLASLLAVVVVFWPAEQLGEMLDAAEMDRRLEESRTHAADWAQRRAARASEAREAVEDRDLLETLQQADEGDSPLEWHSRRMAAKKLAVERLKAGELEGAALRSTTLAVFTNGDPPIFQRRGVPHRLRGIAIEQLVAKGEFEALLDEAPAVVFQLLQDNRRRVSLKGLDEAAITAVTAAAVERSNEDTRVARIARQIAVLGRRHIEGVDVDLKAESGAR